MNLKPKTRKEEIISVAAKLFKEKGYSAVTMRDLAAAMGIKAASLYNHISSKQTILQDIIIAIAEEFTNEMATIINTEGSSIYKLERIINLHVEIAVKNTDGLSALNSDWMHLESQLDYYLELRQNYESNFLTIVNEGIQKGEIKPINPDVLMFSMLSTLRSLYMWIPKKNNIESPILAKQLTQVLLQGVNH